MFPIIPGCGAVVAPEGSGGSTLPPGTLPPDIEFATVHDEKVANDDLRLAERIDLSTGRAVIRGRIDDPVDLDVYNLGAAQAGDRVVVDVTAAATLDAAVALFDETGASLLVNDHRNVYLGRTGPFIDVTLRRPTQSCFVAISATPGFNAYGDYILDAWIQPVEPYPSPNADVVLLVFHGGRNVRIGGRPAIDVPLFNATRISSDFEGESVRMMNEIVEHVRGDFAGLNATVLSTHEGVEHEPGMTRIYFGTFDAALLGIAEDIDEYNATDGQSAIVFTDTFAAFMPLAPTVSEMAVALANVASHEIGHLLGMVHTTNPVELMDVTGSLNDLLLDQGFARSPIYPLVFPLGDQDGIQYLLDAIGGDDAVLRSHAAAQSPPLETVQKRRDRVSARSIAPFSSCSLQSEVPHP